MNLIRIICIVIYAIIFKWKSKFSTICALSGPVFVKFGQFLSTREDLVGEAVAKDLSELRDKVKPFKADIAKKIIQNEVGMEIFKNFYWKQISSASVAQLYKAQLTNGDVVAVKILRPNIEKVFKRDMNFLFWIGRLMVRLKIVRNMQVIYSLELFKTLFEWEINLLNEVKSSEKMQKNFANDRNFYIPKIYKKYSTKRIIVMEWIDGIPIYDVVAIKNAGIDLKKLAENFVISYLNQVYRDGFFHADMHPGNLLISKNGVINAVDFGITGNFSKEMRRYIAEIFIGFLERDYKTVARLHIKSGLVGKNVNLDRLIDYCKSIGESVVDLPVSQISYGNLLTKLIKMMEDFDMEVKIEFILLQKTIMLVESIAMNLDKEVNISVIARPWMREWAKKNISIDAKILERIQGFFDKIKSILT